MNERSICRRQMMHDLMQVYRETVDGAPIDTTQTEVYQMVVCHPAPRFYIDPRRAHIAVSSMIRGDMSVLDRMGPLKRQMYLDLFGKVMELSQRKGFWGRSLYYILRHAVLEPAPRFYIGTKRMEQVWKEMSVEERRHRCRRPGKPYEKRID